MAFHQKIHRPGLTNLRRVIIALPVGIFLAEVIAMLVIRILDGPYVLIILIDAIITTTLMLPLIYFLSYRPLLKHLAEQKASENIMGIRLRLIQFAASHSIDELLQATLDEIEILTGSSIGFFHFIDSDQDTLWLQTWSTNTLQKMCKAEGKGSHYKVEQAGVWADCIRQRQAVIHNDYPSLLKRQGLPNGHVPIQRELTIPIVRQNNVVAILGVGNKPQDYTSNDVELVSTLADFAWDIIDRARVTEAMRTSEEKFRTLVEWTFDWEKWIDPEGNLVYTSPSCERITGSSPEEFMTNPKLLSDIVHPDDQDFYQEHKNLRHDARAGESTIEYRIVARDGGVHWIEHICRPLFGRNNDYLGRRVSSRDITLRKQIEKKIIDKSQNEVILTQTLQTLQTNIARDLHDTLGQNLSFLNMNLKHLSEIHWSDPHIVKNQIQNMTKVANESYDLVRSMLAILQTGNSTDPLNLFSRYADQVAERSSIQIEITSQGNPHQLFPHQIRQLFFIFREALSNIEKHASSSQVSGEFLWDENFLKMIISDNGRGFDPEATRPTGHYGLKFMRERTELLKGSFMLEAALNQGAMITVVVPYEYETPI